jgi:hypothetical protein
MSIKSLDRLCSRFRSKLRGLVFRNGIARVIAVQLALLVPLIAVDYFAHLGTPLRLLSLAFWLAAFAFGIHAMILIPLRERWTNRQVLAHVDGTTPEARGMLLDLYELQHPEDAGQIQELESETGRQLADQAIADLTPKAEEVRLRRGFYQRNVMRGLGLVLVLIGVWGAVAGLLPEYTRIGAVRFFNPFSGVHWPHRTNIDVTTQQWNVASAEPFVVEALISGEVPPFVLLNYETPAVDFERREKLEIKTREVPAKIPGKPDATKTEHYVHYTFPRVREDVELYLSGGDYKTNTYKILVKKRPYLREITAKYEYPPYAQLPNRTSDKGQLSGLEGTKVKLTFKSSMPLAKAVFRLTVDGKDRDPVAFTGKDLGEDTSTFSHELLLEADGAYQIHLESDSGLTEPKPERYDIVVTPDYPPEVEILDPAADRVRTRTGSLGIAFRYSDDFGFPARNGVQFIYTLGDNKEYVLSDKITGELPTSETQHRVRFNWDLSRMEDLPKKGTLTYWVRVRDLNPTGRGVANSKKWTIKLLTENEIQLAALERAKRLFTAARIAEDNQLKAWQHADLWQRKWGWKLAEGEKPRVETENDEYWTEMKDRQQVAAKAARNIDFHLQFLFDTLKENRMDDQFMSGRLLDIAQYVKTVVNTGMPAIESGIREARPTGAADPGTEGWKRLRTAALKTVMVEQQRNWLILRRIVRKLTDWRDLQTSSVTAGLLFERQEAVIERTREIAPNYIGKKKYDLTDEQLDALLQLAQRQQTIFETESQLEQQLSRAMKKAQDESRGSILFPLQVAFRTLRSERVNDDLKNAAMLIRNNQPAQVDRDQNDAMRVLEVVMRGLIAAGRKVDKEGPIDMKELPPRLPDPGAAPPPPDKPPTGGTSTDGGPGTEIGTENIVKPPPPPPETQLANWILAASGHQEDVWARTKFLGLHLDHTVKLDSKNQVVERKPAQDMPRFHSLTQNILSARQDGALAAVEKAREIARSLGKGYEPVLGFLGHAGTEFGQSREMIGEENYARCTQQAQKGTIDLLKTVRSEYLARQKQIEQKVNGNRQGKDGEPHVHFDGRPYMLREADLDHTAKIALLLNEAFVTEMHVHRTLARLSEEPPKGDRQKQQEQANRDRAAKMQESVGSLVAAAESALGQVREETEYVRTIVKKSGRQTIESKIEMKWKVREVVRETGVNQVLAMKPGDFAADIRAGKKDAGLLGTAKEPGPVPEATRVMLQTVRTLSDLLDAPYTPPLDTKQGPGAKTVERIDREKFEALWKPEAIGERLENSLLPDPIRTRMTKSLESGNLPPKYAELLKAYYNSFTEEAPPE